MSQVTNKQKWFVNDDGTTAIFCEPKKLEDTLAQSMNNWRRAKQVVKKLHLATLQECVKYELGM